MWLWYPGRVSNNQRSPGGAQEEVTGPWLRPVADGFGAVQWPRREPDSQTARAYEAQVLAAHAHVGGGLSRAQEAEARNLSIQPGTKLREAVEALRRGEEASQEAIHSAALAMLPFGMGEALLPLGMGEEPPPFRMGEALPEQVGELAREVISGVRRALTESVDLGEPGKAVWDDAARYWPCFDWRLDELFADPEIKHSPKKPRHMKRWYAKVGQLLGSDYPDAVRSRSGGTHEPSPLERVEQAELTQSVAQALEARNLKAEECCFLALVGEGKSYIEAARRAWPEEAAFEARLSKRAERLMARLRSALEPLVATLPPEHMRDDV